MKTTDDLPPQSTAKRAEVVDLAAVRALKAASKPPSPSRRGWVQWSALIVCVAIGVILARAIGAFDSGPMIGDRHGTLVAQGALANALDQQIAAADAKTGVRIGASFRAVDKRYCRTFQVSQGGDLAGLACRGPSGWQVQVASVPAMASAVNAAMNATIDGAPLDAQAQAAAKAEGWRN